MMSVEEEFNPEYIRKYLKNFGYLKTESIKMLDKFLNEHSSFVAWSGGKDSTVVLHLSILKDPEIPVVFFDSGLEYPETIEYIQTLSEMYKINLTIIKAMPDALTLLSETGFWDNTKDNIVKFKVNDFHNTLIVEPSAKAHAMFGKGEINGLRAEESAGRNILLSSSRGIYYRQKKDYVCSPVWRWTHLDIKTYLAENKIPVNPVYQKLSQLSVEEKHQRVGLAFDANGLEWGRVTWLKAGWPDLWAKIAEQLPRIEEWG